MSERRALLDPDMYKISEEDSQDEEVLSAGGLATITEDGGKLDGEANNNYRGGRDGVRGRWSGNYTMSQFSPGNLNSYGYLHPPSSSTFSSAIQKFGGSKYKMLEGHSPNVNLSLPPSVSTGSMTSYRIDLHEGDNLDWPETSTNSDSCLSSDDKLARKHPPVNSSHKFLTKTYFGDDMKRIGEPLGRESAEGNYGESSHSRHQRRHQLRRRGHTPLTESSSGSGSGSGSSSPCEDCRSTPTQRENGEGSVSSSDVEDYDDESSYSDSSYGDDYQNEYDDEDDHEYFDDNFKFVSDSEVEMSTNQDGDMFLFEYSTDSEPLPIAHVQLEHGERDPNPEGQRDSDSDENPQPPLDIDKNGNTPDATNPPTRIPEQTDPVPGASTPTSPPVTSTEASPHFHKSGKGARGKISRLLKRRREAPVGKAKDADSSKDSTPSPSVDNHVPMPSSTNTLNSNHRAENHQKEVVSFKSGSSSKSKFSSATVAPAPEKVFRFKDEHGGETRTVFVDIPQESNTNLGRRATLIETVLGIIPGKFSAPPGRPSDVTHWAANDRIMVAGFVPDGVASRYRRIKIGDCLELLDNIPVGHTNVDSVLSSRLVHGDKKTVAEIEYISLKLTLRRVAGCMVFVPTNTTESTPEPRTTVRSTSSKMSCSEVSAHVQSNLALLFISTGSSQHDDESNASSSNAATSSSANHTDKEKSKDVVYCWPKESESKIVKSLAAAQGMFSTLYRLLRDVTGSYPVVSKVLIDDCEMDVTYMSDDDGKSLLLLAVATSLSTFTVDQHAKPEKPGNSTSGAIEGKKREKKIRWREPQAGGVTVSTRVMMRVQSLLNYQFGSLWRAFKESRGDKVDRFMNNSICALNELSEDFLFLQVPGNFLRFPSSILSGIDDMLYSFETSDALYRRDTSRRSRNSQDVPVFHCHGSCLMYKGSLVTSHLENELASSFHGWWRTQLGLWGLKGNRLADNWKPVSRLVLWQQTYIPNKFGGASTTGGGNTSTSETTPSNDQHGPGRKKKSSIEGRGGVTLNTPSVGDNVYPPQEDNNEGEDDGDATSSGSRQRINSPCFSGLVGIGNMTLGFVLENLTDNRRNVRPDAGWIRRALATLCRLNQSGLTRRFETWVEKQEKEEFVELCCNSLTTTGKSRRHRQSQQDSKSSQNSSLSTPTSGSTPMKKSPGTSSILKNSSSGGPTSLMSPSSSSSHPSHLSSSPFSSASAMKNFMIGNPSPATTMSNSVRPGILPQQFQFSHQNYPPGFDDMSPSSGGGGEIPGDSDDDDMDDTTTGTGSDNSSFVWYESGIDPNSSAEGDVKSIRVTKGNVLFDYIQVEFGRGVMLSTKDVHQGWSDVVRHNFRQSSTVIHQILHKAANSRQRLEERGKDKKWVSRALAPISEHGILFTCQIVDPRDLRKKKPRKRDVVYWVVGRIYPDEREIYVCYEDGPMTQNLIEIAYKLALNVHC